MPSNQYLHVIPIIDPSAYVADTAVLIGAVTLGKQASVWFHTVIRADDEPIIIGDGSNIQDGTIIHIDPGYPTILGKYVTVGHRAVVHGAEVADHVLISMGSIILTGAKVGENSIIGAGALVTERMVVPPNSVVLGIPGRVVRQVTDEQVERIRQTAEAYIERGQVYKQR
ncbi:MAG: gamma carbonic anhydrase family protein [Candidatus Latescibacteria bacterium]|nr:gamma carbonic anhydrase family protein [Candidatus Latescibacterota bacterium]